MTQRLVIVVPPLLRAEALEAPERAERKAWRAPKRVASERRTPRLRAQNVRAPPRGDGAETKTFYILERNIRKP